MGGLSVRVLGPLEAAVDERPVKLGGAKQRTVLACLALRSNAVVSTDTLIDVLWNDHQPARPRAVLQVYVANLRRLLKSDVAGGSADQRLVSHPTGYRLDLADDEVDLLRFDRLVEQGHDAAEGADLVGAAEKLRQALGLFHDPVLPDLADADAFASDLTELEERRLDVQQELFELDLALGRHAAVLPELQGLAAAQPFRERLWASLVLALYRCDRQADALATCRSARQLFADELGLDPGPELQRLEQAVLRQDPALAAPAHEAAHHVKRRLDNLPAAVTPLVGRESEVEEVTAALIGGQTRLLTVTGPGGSGKTRLALAAASVVGRRTPDGVCWVELSQLTEAKQVAPAIANALGVGDSADAPPLDTATAFLRERSLLLVLDNFEHVEPAWDVVAHLLAAAPGLQILITSRRALQVRGEYDYMLPPLALPPIDPPLPPSLLVDVAAVRLFVDRGRTVRRDFTVTGANAAAVTKICHRLDGLPLAIELAAANLRHRTESELLDGLNQGLAGLPAGPHDLPDRQRTLTATIGWSYRLLDHPTRQLFDQLGVFAGDPTPSAVRAVCGTRNDTAASIDARLADIVDHSLLRRDHTPGREPRLLMLQSVRDYARDQLARRADAANVRRRHAEHFTTVAEDLGPRLFGHEQVNALRTLQATAADLRSALIWASGRTGSTTLALRLIGSLWHYWELTREIAEPCAVADAVVDGIHDMDPRLTGPAISGAATLNWLQGRISRAVRLHEEALAAYRSVGDRDGIAWSLMCLAVQACDSNQWESATRLANEALAAEDGTARSRVGAFIVLGMLALRRNDPKGAAYLYQRGLHLARESGDQWLVAVTSTNFAEAALWLGDLATAEAMLREALLTCRDIGAHLLAAASLETLADLLLSLDRPEEAARVLGAVDAYRHDMAAPLGAHERARVDALIADIRAAAGPVHFAVAWAADRELTLDEVVEEALATT